MFVIREIVHCKPGTVRQVIERFRGLCSVMKDMGYEPFRLLTDVSGEPFWTVVAEASAENIDDFFAMQQKLMANEIVGRIMANHHDLVAGGRREIYRIEN